MNQLNEMPQDVTAGLDFNYAVWAPGTRVSLVNVPWNNDYRDIVKFDSRTALNAYLTTLEIAEGIIEDMSYLKPNMPVRVPIPFNSALKYNYLRASNPIQAVPGDVLKDFYYFITDVRYLAPNTTELVLQLDVWQTFGFDISFGNCYVERGHIGVANDNAFQNYGRDYLTVPEGIDIGGEYQVITRRKRGVMDIKQAPADGFSGNFLILSTINLAAASYGTVSAPILETANGDSIQGLPSGAEAYVVLSIGELQALMANLSAYPWISQGIVSITAIPDPTAFGFTVSGPISTPAGFIHKVTGYGAHARISQLLANWRDHANINDAIPVRYQHLKKLKTYPYMALEMTTWTGKPIIIKPESWNDANAEISERLIITPPNQRLVITPNKYNAKTGAAVDSWPSEVGGVTNYGDDGGDYLDFSTFISNFPTFAIVNNMGIAYLASNANSIAFQNQSADWAQQRALRGNQTSYDQATSAMNLANELTGVGTGLGSAQTSLANQYIADSYLVNGVSGVLGGIGQGALGGASAGPQGAAIGAGLGAAGSIGGAVRNGIMAQMDMTRNTASQANQANAANMSNKASVNNQGYVRDTNKGLADWAANGDYENTIAGINAKVQDARLTQPSTSGQVGGEAFNLVYNAMEVSLRWKLIDASALRIVGEYWLRYGYAVRAFITPPTSLQVMTKFTYWKLLETYIVGGNMPETFKQSIRGIFEKGVTVWKTPSDIGNIDIGTNAVVPGTSY